MLTLYATMPRVPVYDDEWSCTHVSVWDTAAAHLLLEDAIRRIPDEAAGQAFLISGDAPPWRSSDIRRAIQVAFYSVRAVLNRD